MDFDYSPKVQDLRKKVSQFMDEHVHPNEQTFEDQLNSGPDRWQIRRLSKRSKRGPRVPGSGTCFCRRASTAIA